jgi:hypothetical protein
MKKTLLLFGLCLMATACADDDATPTNSPNPTSGNKVLALKIDLLTNTFEGGKEMEFDATVDNFTIAADYDFPGDFGGVTLNYAEVSQPLFSGTIHWMGLGEMTYPVIDAPTAFAVMDNETPQPAAANFEVIAYSEYGYTQPYFEEAPDYNAIWDAVDHLQLVEDYRTANPTAKVQLFLYTPSVGGGDPTQWDWIVFLKN